MTISLYDQLGGFSKVRKVVSDFYDRVLEEEDLAPLRMIFTQAGFGI
jgi:truncated hemoglobin YjbI